MQESIQLLTDRHGQRHIGRAFRQSVTFSGERHCLLGMVVDVTETTELANNQAALNECFATMFNSGKSDTLSEIIGIMCRRLDAARGYLIKFDFVGGRFVPEAEYLGVAGELKPVNDQSFSINNNLYRVLTSDGIVMAPDVNDPEAIEKLGLWKTENERYGVRSLYCALVSANDAPWGYIAVTYENDCRQISEYEKNFLLSVARLGGLMIERRWAAEQQQLTIAELRNNKSLMEYGATLTKSGVFRYDLSEDSIVGSKGVEELFAIESGKALPPEKWVCPEDLTEIRRQLDNIYGGKTDQVTFNFRSNYFGERRNYRMLFSRDKNSKKNIFFGAIQDITEITLQSEKLRETMSLWNLVLDLIPVMIFAKRADDNFRYTLANKAFISFTGKPLDEIVGHCDAEIFDRPDDCEWFDECDRAVMADNNSKSFVENVAGGGGIMHSIRTTKMPFTDANGRRLLLAACMDVTELNDLIANLNVLNSCLEIFFRSENSSEALLALLKNIAAHMKADYVYVLRLDLNQGLADTVMDYAVAPMEPFLHGLKSMPLDVNDLSVRYLKEHFECFLNNVRDPEQRKILHSWERFFGKYDMRSLYFSGIRQDGEIWGDLGVAYTGKPHQMSDLDRQFLRSTAHLIELLLERERSADKLRSALTQAQAAERAKSMFLASMSHEIRTPLNAVIGFSELLKEGTPTPREQQEYLDGIFSSGNALLELINDVLDLSKLEA
ncbi:MAG: histidine kinase dimerization/phospho-acceptor domain-containing protein, partial [Victivallaceae bacterium]